MQCAVNLFIYQAREYRQQGFWHPSFYGIIRFGFPALLSLRKGKVNTSLFFSLLSLSKHSLSSKKINKERNTTIYPPSKQRLHKVCFLQNQGCQKPCCSLVNKEVVCSMQRTLCIITRPGHLHGGNICQCYPCRSSAIWQRTDCSIISVSHTLN